MKHVMLSHVSRASTRRPKSVEQLRAAGIEPVIVESVAERVAHTAPEVRRRGYDALKIAAGDPDGLVFYEDDVLVNPRLYLRHLRMAVDARAVVTFCALKPRLYPPGVSKAARLPVTLLPVPAYDENKGWFGSQAVYLPPAMVAYGLDHPEEFMQPDGSPLAEPVVQADVWRGFVTGFDFWIKSRARLFGGIFVAVPNSVDHDDQGSVRLRGSRPPWTSPTFRTPEAT